MYLPRPCLEKGVLYLTQWNVLKIVRCGGSVLNLSMFLILLFTLSVVMECGDIYSSFRPKQSNVIKYAIQVFNHKI